MEEPEFFSEYYPFENEMDLTRETKKHILSIILSDGYNVLDSAIEETIQEKKGIYNNANIELKELNESDSNEEGSEETLLYYSALNDILIRQEEATDELIALFELKIIYAFKHLEINLKKLLSTAYEHSPKKSYKWENLMEFIKFRDIEPKSLKGYDEVNQLRIVNNSLKHSENLLNDSLLRIQEFKGKETLLYEDLESFYERIKGAPSSFLHDLLEAIITDLYCFDNDRISKQAELLAERMDKTSALKFIDEFKKLYD